VLVFEPFCVFLQFSRNLGLFDRVKFVTQDTIPWHALTMVLYSDTTTAPRNLFNIFFLGIQSKNTKWRCWIIRNLTSLVKTRRWKNSRNWGRKHDPPTFVLSVTWWFKLGCRLEYFVKFFWRFEAFFSHDFEGSKDSLLLTNGSVTYFEKKFIRGLVNFHPLSHDVHIQVFWSDESNPIFFTLCVMMLIFFGSDESNPIYSVVNWIESIQMWWSPVFAKYLFV